jgi:hypothetical protein
MIALSAGNAFERVQGLWNQLLQIPERTECLSCDTSENAAINAIIEGLSLVGVRLSQHLLAPTRSTWKAVRSGSENRFRFKLTSDVGDV